MKRYGAGMKTIVTSSQDIYLAGHPIQHHEKALQP